MDKSDWYSDDHPEVELWDSEWNDHLVSIETFQRVHLRANVRMVDSEETAVFVEFLDGTAAPQPGGVTLG